ncbi:MAG: hypothetical protein H8E84_08985 [Flavobacteriales bacterium]|nr:hypothetical protein [Flavobacteriales bacterium]
MLNFGTSVTWSKWWTFKQLFGNHYDKISDFGKPIMITEFGSLSIGGDRSKWFSDAIQQFPTEYPAIKSVLFFHYSSDETISDKAINWYFINDKPTLEVIRTELNNWPDSLKTL